MTLAEWLERARDHYRLAQTISIDVPQEVLAEIEALQSKPDYPHEEIAEMQHRLTVTPCALVEKCVGGELTKTLAERDEEIEALRAENERLVDSIQRRESWQRTAEDACERLEGKLERAEAVIAVAAEVADSMVYAGGGYYNLSAGVMTKLRRAIGDWQEDQG